MMAAGAGLGLGYGGGGYGMMEQQQPLSRAIGQVGDRVGKFEAGAHCTYSRTASVLHSP
jgi:hypothetical protein